MAPPGDGGEGVLDEAGLVERVRVQRDLDPGGVGDPQAGVDRGGCRAPVLVQLEPGRAGAELFPHRRVADRVPLAEQDDVHRPVVHRGEHPAEVPRARRHGGRLRALGRAGAAADEGRDPGAERLGHLLRADEVHVAVDRARGEDLPVPGDDLRAGPDGQAGMDAVHGVRVAGLTERDDPPVADTDVGLDHPPVVEHHGAGDDEIGRALRAGRQRLPHGFADDLAAAEDRLVAGAAEGRAPAAVLGDLDDQIGVGEPDAVTDRRVHTGRRSGSGPAGS